MLSTAVRALVLVAVFGAAGCVAPLPYAPERDLVESMGKRDAVQELKNALTASRFPPVIEVRLTGDQIEFVAMLETAPFTTRPVRKRIPLRPLSDVEVYPNAKLFLYHGGRKTHEFLFESVADAQRAADAIWSFRTHVRNPVESRVPPPRQPVSRPRTQI